MRNSPLLGICMAWLVTIILLRGQLGFVGVVLDYLYILAIAFFSAYFGRTEIIMLLGGYLGFMYYIYFFVSMPSMIAAERFNFGLNELSPQTISTIIFASNYVIVPLAMLGSMFLTYGINKRLIKRLKLRERIGKVIVV